MANNYCLSSSKLELTKQQLKKARRIVAKVVKDLEDGDQGCCGTEVVMEPDGVWLTHDESFNPDHAEQIVSALIDGLKIDKPFYCSWAYTCDHPRLDEFGGGCFCVRLGKDTRWVDARSECEKQVNEEPT